MFFKKTVASLKGQFTTIIKDLEAIEDRECKNIEEAEIELERATAEAASAARFKCKLKELVE